MPTRNRPRSGRANALGQLRALISGLSTSARAVERRTGVTNAQLFLLQQLATDGPHSLGELAARAQTTPSTVSIVVARLGRAGLVTKIRAAEDRRRAVVTLTAAGRRLIRRAPEAPTARLLAALERLTSGEARTLERGLAPLLHHLALSADNPPLLFEHQGRPAATSSRSG